MLFENLEVVDASTRGQRKGLKQPLEAIHSWSNLQGWVSSVGQHSHVILIAQTAESQSMSDRDGGLSYIPNAYKSSRYPLVSWGMP
jgi:hypothetical protein